MMKKISPACFCLGSILVTLLFHSVGTAQNVGAAQTEMRAVYQNNFDQHTASKLYTVEDLATDWDSPRWDNGVEDGRVSIVAGEEAFGGQGSCLAVRYPKGQFGSQESGAQWKMELQDGIEEATLSYKVKFAKGFDFVRGGKFPGLGGGTAPTGSKKANGTNGWTTRYMWKTGFTGASGFPAQRRTRMISYAKYANSGRRGDGARSDEVFWRDAGRARIQLQANVWYQFTQRIRLNTPGEEDGVIQIWLNDDLVVEQTNVHFRSAADLKVDVFYFSTFFGGKDEWGPSKDEVIYFDDFRILVSQDTVLEPESDGN